SIVALRRGLTHAPLEVIRLENSYHVATMDNDAPTIFRGSAEFIRSVAAGGTPDAHASQKDTADE
ncbi:MAG TPA: esterase, partial [Arthrobacter sp.]|nr:esterase [Arthrobacter sp.]